VVWSPFRVRAAIRPHPQRHAKKNRQRRQTARPDQFIKEKSTGISAYTDGGLTPTSLTVPLAQISSRIKGESVPRTTPRDSG
jgi:hypothetical protein